MGFNVTLKNVQFTVLITFDITVDGRTGVYAEVTELLSDKGFKKESPSGEEFPENVYYGVVQRYVEFKDSGAVSVDELKIASSNICDQVVELLGEIFDFQDVKNKILVHVARKTTSTTRLE